MDGLAQGRQGEWVRPREAELPQLDPTVWVEYGMISPDGSISLPPRFSQELALQPGEEVVLKMLEGGVVRVETPAGALKRIQDYTLARVPPGTSAVDGLIAERRLEAAQEGI